MECPLWPIRAVITIRAPQLLSLIGEFKEQGGRGIEVVTGSHSPGQYGEFAEIARHFDLLASRGSDFHGPLESKIDLGKLPALPADLKPGMERSAIAFIRWLSSSQSIRSIRNAA